MFYRKPSRLIQMKYTYVDFGITKLKFCIE